MAKIEIYTTPTCGFCMAAKALLQGKDAAYEEISVIDPGVRAHMTNRAHGRLTVPQIFIDGQHIGGFDDLSALNRAGKLDPLLVV